MADRVVVVTGGGRGIGRAVCQRFAEDGAQVIAVARSVNELETTRSQIEDAGGRCRYESADVTKPAQLHSVIESTVAKFGSVDALVNCAGIAPLGGIEEISPNVFDAMLAVNVHGVFHACRAVWPVMKAQETGGVIITISSAASTDPFPGLGAYGATKAWVNLWTKALAGEGAAVGIRVFAVAPGAVETRMLRGAFPDFPAEQTLAPATVAGVVHALADPACASASGETVFVKK